MGYEEAMRLEIEELIDEKTALRAQLMGKTTAEAIKMAFDNGDSYLDSVTVRAKQAEAERNTLAARVAELEAALLKLCNEVNGLRSFEHEIRASIGHTNWSVLALREAEGMSALARTAPQSLALVKAAALREAAQECQEVMPDDLPHLTYNQLIDMADSLEAEAANG